MPTIREYTTYKFDELSKSAKETAREWYRNGNYEDNYFSARVIEDAATTADILGIDFRQSAVKLMNGTTRYKPTVYWSGFSSQGDGTCFEGSYSYKKGFRKALFAHIGPESKGDKELVRIANALFDVQKRNFFQLSASMTHSGHYSHSGCMNVEVTRTNDLPVSESDEDDLTQIMRDFADWIYSQLESEWYYINTDSQVDESITANGYDFDEHGNVISCLSPFTHTN